MERGGATLNLLLKNKEEEWGGPKDIFAIIVLTGSLVDPVGSTNHSGV